MLRDFTKKRRQWYRSQIFFLFLGSRLFQCAGQCALPTIFLIILVSGGASSTLNSLMIDRGKSDGTPDCDFLAFLIFRQVSSTITSGWGCVSVRNLVWTWLGNYSTHRDGKVPQMLAYYKFMSKNKQICT